MRNVFDVDIDGCTQSINSRTGQTHIFSVPSSEKSNTTQRNDRVSSLVITDGMLRCTMVYLWQDDFTNFEYAYMVPVKEPHTNKLGDIIVIFITMIKNLSPQPSRSRMPS